MSASPHIVLSPLFCCVDETCRTILKHDNVDIIISTRFSRPPHVPRFGHHRRWFPCFTKSQLRQPITLPDSRTATHCPSHDAHLNTFVIHHSRSFQPLARARCAHIVGYANLIRLPSPLPTVRNLILHGSRVTAHAVRWHLRNLTPILLVAASPFSMTDDPITCPQWLSFRKFIAALFLWTDERLDSSENVALVCRDNFKSYFKMLTNLSSDYCKALIKDTKTYTRECNGSDRPNSHCLKELVVYIVPISVLSLISELIIEVVHQIFKPCLETNTHSDVHLTVVEIGLCWQRGLNVYTHYIV